MSAVSPLLSYVPAARILRLAAAQRHTSSACCSTAAHILRVLLLRRFDARFRMPAAAPTAD
ncbi:hypothetical protein [Paenarthrobacter nitroguajacolicus]|uniref:hypothetical protein n=1 Tax=Paenarthrobacter nitroguajacolicus TaxID=211146 RepID=UPI0015BF11B6|nr:hypothetical protein [Paenarthrobacter nitroguajacolicus]